MKKSRNPLLFLSLAVSSSVSCLAADIVLNGGTSNYGVLIRDNFNVTGGSGDVSSFNSGISQSQSGILSPQAYTAIANGGGGWKAQHSNGDRLLVASDVAGAGSVSMNRNFATDANATNSSLSISFQILEVSNYPDPTMWTQFNVSSSQNLDAGNGSVGIASLFRRNGGTGILGASPTLVSGSGFTNWANGDQLTMTFTNTAGTGSAFNGNGSRVNIQLNGSTVGTYSISQQTAAYLTFSAYNYGGDFGLGTFDNLSVRTGSSVNPLGDATSTLSLSNGAIINLSDVEQTVAALQGSSGTTINLLPGLTQGSLLHIDGTVDSNFAGSITGINAELQKSGSSTLTLSGSNTYTGATFVTAGTLLVNGSLGNSTVSVSSGAIIGGTGSLAGDLEFGENSLLRIVNLADALSVAGNITFGSGFGINNLIGLDWDALDLNTSHTLINTSQTFNTAGLDNFGFENRVAVGNTGREAYFTNGSLALVIVPEPSVTLLSGMSLLACLRRRRK
ncbi:MAG: hypothetical protein RL117_2044 [Verrucomicrobiota bacterium]|jgi:fibronectin-binding autotransporter adhesin